MLALDGINFYPIPEPRAFVLAGIGLMGMLVLRGGDDSFCSSRNFKPATAVRLQAGTKVRKSAREKRRNPARIKSPCQSRPDEIRQHPRGSSVPMRKILRFSSTSSTASSPDTLYSQPPGISECPNPTTSDYARADGCNFVERKVFTIHPMPNLTRHVRLVHLDRKPCPSETSRRPARATQAGVPQ